MKVKPGIKIAISGKSGCGNSTVSRLTAERLGLRMINYTFHTVAVEQGIDFYELCQKAEEHPQWDLLVDTRQVELAREGNCVLGSRLAVWLLTGADLTVFLDAPLKVRAHRIHKREGGDYRRVLQQTKERDLRDHARFMKLYKINNNRYQFVDLLIDTTNFTPEQVVDQIVERAVQIPWE